MSSAPTWIFSWCYYYLFATLVAVVVILMQMVGFAKKLSAFEMIAIVFSTVILFAHGITYFWVCRSALNPQK
jgi:hypothetical protein